jgi:hypothetical protein
VQRDAVMVRPDVVQSKVSRAKFAPLFAMHMQKSCI